MSSPKRYELSKIPPSPLLSVARHLSLYPASVYLIRQGVLLVRLRYIEGTSGHPPGLVTALVTGAGGT